MFYEGKGYLDLDAFLYESPDGDFRRDIDAIIFTEDALFVEAASDIIQTLVDSFIATVQKIKEAFLNFIQKKTTKDAIDKAEDAIKENPEVANKKIKVTDTSKLEKNAEDTIKDISKAHSVDEVVRRMDKYRKQRNTLIKITAAVTITAAAAILLIKKADNKIINKINEELKNAKDTLNDREKIILSQSKTIDNQKKTIKELQGTKGNDNDTTIADNAKLEAAKIRSTLDVGKELLGDLAGGVKKTANEVFKLTVTNVVTGNDDGNPVDDVKKGVSDAVHNMTNDLKENGEAKIHSATIDNLRKDRVGVIKKLRTLTKILNGEVPPTKNLRVSRVVSDYNGYKKDLESIERQLGKLGVNMQEANIPALNKRGKDLRKKFTGVIPL